jgi:hypothetical protein
MREQDVRRVTLKGSLNQLPIDLVSFSRNAFEGAPYSHLVLFKIVKQQKVTESRRIDVAR